MVDWTAYIIYSPLDEDSTATLWTRDVLISMREFESDIKSSDEYTVSCKADPQLSTAEEIVCDVRAFLSPLDLFASSGSSVVNLETMTDEEIQTVINE